MFALGCIQALKCNTNQCPTGVATQNNALVKGLVVSNKSQRVANFHRKTVESALELLGAAGLHHPSELKPDHIFRRTGLGEMKPLGEIYPCIPEGALLEKQVPEKFCADWKKARPDSF